MHKTPAKLYAIADGIHCTSAQVLAAQVGISVTTARHRLNNWPADRWYEPAREKQTKGRVPLSKVVAMRELRAAGMSYQEIGAEVGLNASSAFQYLSPKGKYANEG